MYTLTLEERKNFYKDAEIKDFGPEEFIIKDGVLEHYNGTSVHVVIPDGVKKIADGAFLRGGAKAVKIESVVIRGIEIDTVFGCNDSLKEVRLPEGLEVLQSCTFLECNALEKVILSQDFSAPRWSFEYWGITKK